MVKNWLLLLFLWLLLILGINIQGDFPLNDDWQYAYGVKSLLETGRLSYQSYFSPIVLAQVLWGYGFHWLLGSTFNFVVLRWSVLLLVPLGIWWVMDLCKELGTSSRQAVLLSGFLFCTTPLLFVLAPSFMSDVPFVVAVLGALAAYWKYSHRNRLPYLLLSILWSAVAFYIRQPGLLLPFAFACHSAWHQYRSGVRGLARSVMIALFGLIISIGLLLSWEWGLRPGLGLEENFKSDSRQYLSLLTESPLTFVLTWALRMVKSFIYLSLFTLPLLPWYWRNASFRAFWTDGFLRWVVVLTSLLLIVSSHWAGKPFPFGGNIFFNFGLGPELLADAYTLQLEHTPRLPQWIMDVLHGLAAAWGLSLSYLLRSRFRDCSARWQSFLRLWLIFSFLYLSSMAVTSYYDRYVLPPLALLIPLLASFAVGRTTTARRWGQWIPALVVLVFSFLATHDYLAWNRARLLAWTWLQEQEIDIRQVDAGYEWNGWLNYGAPRLESEEVPFWWVTDNRFMIAFGPVPGYREIHGVPYARWLWMKEDKVWVLERVRN